MKITLTGAPRTKKNSQVIVRGNGGRPIPLPSKDYRDYEKACLRQLKGIRLDMEPPFNVSCVYYMPTHRRVDLVNLIEATCDILVAGGILPDDNSGIIAGHDGSRVAWDKGNPRVEIEISGMEET